MKKTLRFALTLAAVVLLLVPACSAFAQATPFTPQDLNVNTVYAGATPDEVRVAIGEPSAKDKSTVAATGENLETWQFGGLTLVFADGKLTGAEWNDPNLTGPRGLKVGDSQDTVSSAFFVDAAQTSPDVLYTAGVAGASHLPRTFQSQKDHASHASHQRSP